MVVTNEKARVSGQSPQSELQYYLQLANQSRQLGDSAGEVRALDKALAIAPGDAAVANARGMRALADRDFALAEDLFERAHQADPTAAPLLMNLATARRNRGDFAAELRALEAVEALDQLHFMAQLRLAEWHEQHGDEIVAIEYWRHVLAIAPALRAEGGQVSPALEARLAHAHTVVKAHNERFKAELNASLEAVRETADVRARRRFEACVGVALGERRVYHNECAGLHYPFLPEDEFFERSHFPWMRELEAHTDAIRAEVLALMADGSDVIRPYVRMEQGLPDNKWTPLDNKLDWGACFLWEYGEPNQPVLDRCPQTAKALEALPRNHIPGRAPSAFFSILRPKTHIPPHTGVTNTRAIVHLPLIVPDDCGFRVGNEVRQWVPGQAFAFDDTIEHEAWNKSDDVRVVLIFDVWNPHLSAEEQRLLVEYFEATDSLDMNPIERRKRHQQRMASR